MVYADFRVTAQSEEDLAMFAHLCAVIQYAGDIGHSASLNVVVDGDGSGRYKFKINGKELPSNKDWKEDDAIWLGE